MIWIYLFYLVIWLNNIWMYSFTWIIPSIIITQIQHETSNTQYPAFRIEYPTSNIQYSTSHFMYIINKMMILEWKKQKNNHFPFSWSSWFFLWILLFLLLLFSCFFYIIITSTQFILRSVIKSDAKQIQKKVVLKVEVRK